MASAVPHDIPDVLVIDKPEQLKALGHPLRLRVLETLGAKEEQLSNRELAQRLGVDPGHLHFHVRMLLKAGLIEPVPGGRGREKPYRVAAKTVRIAPELIATGASGDLQAAMLDELHRGAAEYGPQGRFRFVRVTVRLDPERAFELLTDLVAKAQELEDETSEPLVITAAAHPPPSEGVS